ncbi:MAG: LPS export ABC transporter periplasmic protein LptC [Omnitrophica bacterium RIFCSPLOWO2_12_FULL_50_11]|nr:MAG: LPS export ABC transporter periplasmic protein LptC [Omnitrophica bacterium RIFCSPLOWO2_12_FULL_50_11]
MIRKLLCGTAILILAYLALIQWKIWGHVKRSVDASLQGQGQQTGDSVQRVYSFSFSKYTETGERELEIEGDTANILAEQVKLMNVIAKAYAEESPVTITADHGTFDKASGDVYLNQNVVATTEDGARLITEELVIHPDKSGMETEIKAKVKRENIHIEGLGAKSNAAIGHVKFKKNVTVVIQDPNSDSDIPTVITCDGPLEIDYKRNVAHFKHNVVAKDDRGTLSSDYMDVFYDKGTRRVSKMLARGNVVILDKEGNKSYSDTAIYLADEGRMILGGDVDAEYRSEITARESELFGGGF